MMIGMLAAWGSVPAPVAAQSFLDHHALSG